MRVTDTIDQPGGRVAYFMDQSIPEAVLEEGCKEKMSAHTNSGQPATQPPLDAQPHYTQRCLLQAYMGRRKR